MGKVEKLTLKNFKSFRKAAIPMSEGYTTIVGPNGSGKSNLIDAFCFAIGTSSMKNLRADRLTDLVNHASPDGTAAVEVTFCDNSGDSHVVSRTIDKSGQSVFRVNNRRTTKFQIEEVLRRMNIHADGHNIIMQGDVNRFIKMTPLQRRTLIDEVSGIAEYEMKKEESMRELGKVEEKIKESSIVLAEREGYLRVLEKEKVEAEVFISLRGEMNKYKATLVKKDLETVEKVFIKAAEFIEKSRDDIEEKKKEQKKLFEKLGDFEKKADELGKKIFKEADKKQSGIQREVEESKASITILEERAKQLKESIQGNLSEIEDLNKQISLIGNSIKAKEKEADSFSNEEDNLLKKLHEKQRELESLLKKAGIGKGFEKALKQADEISRRIEEAKEKMHKAVSEFVSINERLELKKASLESKSSEMQLFREKKEDYSRKIKEALEKKKNALEKLRNFETQSSKFFEMEKDDNRRFEKLEKELLSCRQKHSNLSGKISAVKTIAGMSEATEAVIESAKKKELKGILGTVGELCKCDSEHSTAVETAAGTRMFYLVTETSADATEAVKFIKRNKLGRASFIPLDKIKPVGISKDLKGLSSHEEAVDFAINLVKFKEKLRPVFEFVFGDTLVVNDVDSLREIGIGRVRMVTKEGDLAEFSGLITGGFSKKTVTQNDMRTVAELEQQIKELEGSKSAVVSNIELARKKISEIRDERSALELEFKETEVMLKEWQERINEYDCSSKPDSVSGLEKEIEGLEKAALDKKKLKESLEAEANRMISERSKLKQSVNFDEGGADELSEAQKEVQDLKDNLGDLKLKRQMARSEIENVFAKKQKEIQAGIKKIKALNADYEKRIGEINSKRNETFRSLKEKEEKARKAATSMTDMYAEKEKLEKEKHKIGVKIGELNREIDRIREEMNLREIDKAKVEEKYTDLKRQWEKLKDAEILDITRKALEEGIERVQKQLDTIGNVNMKAIDMFNEYSSEVKEIKEKRGKLSSEKESIISMITEIEEKKLKVFMETFNSLNVNFNKYFKELYPEEGSEASLSLESIEKPLEGGLVVTACPAGKPVKLIDLLSGGEKTLTTLAFLFAVQAYKPSPFYILDEVDAALDDENSTRIARMLKRASSELQFIIVTHNPLITREADQIIGVHMGKDSSSIVEVDLKSYTIGNFVERK